MEILNDQKVEQQEAPQTPKQPTEPKSNNVARTSVFVGLLLIVLGGLWMMSNLGVIGPKVFDIIFSWQMLLVILGAYFVVVRNYWIGGSLVAVGTLFLLTDYFNIHIPVVEIFLSAIVIAMGVGLIFARNR